MRRLWLITVLVALCRVVSGFQVSNTVTWQAAFTDYGYPPPGSNGNLSPTSLILGGYWALGPNTLLTGTVTFSPALEPTQYVELGVMTLQQVTALFIGFDVTKFNEPAYRRYQRNVFTEAPDLTTGGTVVTVPPTLIQTLDHYYLVVTSDLPVAALTTGVQMQVALNIASTVTTDKYRYLNAIEPALFRFQLGSTLLHLGGLLLVTLLYFAYVDPHTKRYIRPCSVLQYFCLAYFGFAFLGGLFYVAFYIPYMQRDAPIVPFYYMGAILDALREMSFVACMLTIALGIDLIRPASAVKRHEYIFTACGFIIYGFLSLFAANCVAQEPHASIPSSWLPLKVTDLYPSSGVLNEIQAISTTCTGVSVAHYVIRFIITFACMILVNATCDVLRDLSINRELGLRQRPGATDKKDNRIITILKGSAMINWYRRMVMFETFRGMFLLYLIVPVLYLVIQGIVLDYTNSWVAELYLRVCELVLASRLTLYFRPVPSYHDQAVLLPSITTPQPHGPPPTQAMPQSASPQPQPAVPTLASPPPLPPAAAAHPSPVQPVPAQEAVPSATEVKITSLPSYHTHVQQSADAGVASTRLVMVEKSEEVRSAAAIHEAQVLPNQVAILEPASATSSSSAITQREESSTLSQRKSTSHLPTEE